MSEKPKPLTVKDTHPHRFYASYDITAPQPTAVTGWHDVWAMRAPHNVLAAKNMIPVTKEQWYDHSFHKHTGKGVLNGVIIDYEAPRSPVTYFEALHILTQVREYVLHNYVMMNTPTPDAWVEYMRALAAVVAEGKTTTTALPAEPNGVIM